MNLNRNLEEMTKQFGITYFGVADLSKEQNAIINHGGDIVAGYPYSISLGIALPKSIVDQLPNRAQKATTLNYKYHGYEYINQRLDLAASFMSSFIQDKGYRVLPIPASLIVDDEKLYGSFSHKMGARLAGLGWIGKSCMLITQKHGPRVRWATILTDAPLVPTGSPIDKGCGKCAKCTDICPVKAFSGRDFIPDEPREMRYDAQKCNNYFKELKESGQVDFCGLCLYVCPFGRK